VSDQDETEAECGDAEGCEFCAGIEEVIAE
jgi:hypothetical protein